MNRKNLKLEARKNMGKHYWLFLFVCLIAAVIGTDFANSITMVKLPVSEISNSVKNGDEGIISVLDETFNLNLGSSINSDNKTLESVFSPTRGVLAEAVNMATSGKISVRIVQMVNSVVHSASFTRTILIIISFFVMLAAWFLIQNMYSVILIRMFLEGRQYKTVPVRRLMFLADNKKWIKASFAMAYRYVFQFLWSLTIVGGIIKHYSYWMVPYIVAENPDIGAKEALKLSVKMMKGHKWECFVLELSYLGWWILGQITLGLTDLFYVNSYSTAAYCEYYGYIRSMSGALSTRFNDKYLFETADSTVLDEAYEEVKLIEFNPPVLKGFKKFVSNIFGISVYKEEDEKLYRQAENSSMRYERYRATKNREIYPTRLSPLYSEANEKTQRNSDYFRHYRFSSVSLMFFLFSIGGWLWELVIHYIAEGEFVNRGMLYGPWLLIYGSGGALILTFLYRFRKNPAQEIIGIVLLCGTFEYLCSYFMELAHGARWWDYTGYFINLNGRICAESVLTFAVAGTAFVYILAPRLDDIFSKFNKKAVFILLMVLHITMLGDLAYSSFKPNEGKGITDDAPKAEDSVPVDDGVSAVDLM